MSLSPGTRLGPYEVTALIGQGGMGEVYRARDTQLGRDVALKTLPDVFAADPDRLARFKREAQILASLNHPNIAAIYGIEEAEGARALVLELVEGPTLADRIAQGAIPIDQALPIARQMAEALEAAHEAGVIHRDLKPANVKVKSDGLVKVLDFGLAKALAPESEGDPSESPTLTAAATQKGVIMGTAAYMSPEQARGKTVDKRADIWAFGVVLYEMVTGRRAFEGRDVSDTLAGVIKSEPSWERLPADLPLKLNNLLRRCLEKEPKRRLRDIGDGLAEIEEASRRPSSAPAAAVPIAFQPAGRQRTVWVALAALVVGSLSTGIGVWNLKPEPPGLLARFAIPPPPLGALDINANDTDVAITPDGTHIVYPGRLEGGQRQLFVRALDQLEATPLGRLGTSPRNPFISPDGGWIGYFDGVSGLRKISIQGGPPVTICASCGGASRGASWGPDDTIIFATNGSSGLLRVSANGGEPEELTTPAFDKEERDHLWPEILPGGQSVLFTITRSPIQNSEIAVLALETAEQKVLIQGGSNAHYTPTGHLVYGVAGTLRAVRFDLSRLEVIGDPVPVLGEVNTKSTGAADFSLSANGSLVYVPGGTTAQRTLGWVNREGQMTPLIEDEPVTGMPRLSPDGQRVALVMTGDSGSEDIWIWDLERDSGTRLTVEGSSRRPAWAPDGSTVTFDSDRSGARSLYSRRADLSGAAELLLETPEISVAGSWSPDARTFVYYEINTAAQRDIWSLEVDGAPSLFLATEFNEFAPRLSPDGYWLAYVSDQSGENRVYVQPFPEGGTVIPISTAAGTEPVWSRDGGELFYRNGNQMMVVGVETEPEFTVGRSAQLFEGIYDTDPSAVGVPNYDVSLDGQRFLMVRRSDTSEAAPLTFVENWFEELKRLVPVN